MPPSDETPQPSLDRRALGLLEALADIPPGDRDAWLDAHCDDPDLVLRIRSMLTANSRLMMQTGGAINDALDEDLPERIGAYRIVERIGRGGMGAVYKGERDTGDFAHTAAIKLIKPGLLSDRLVERFQRERQTLATLEHPYIARLYDGGQTADGAPYIIMEHIDGEPILAWAARRGLSLDHRLSLFGHVCEAVAHAHRNLIIHRDITPSNVLVTNDGTVKLIDFGIAKPADEPGAEQAESSLAALTLTPGYAAPERMARGEATTASDVYSLGRFLDAVASGDNDSEIAAIVARATEPDPASRYPTVDALRTDIAAYRSNFPVSAMNGGRRYLVRKFVARHQLGVAASAVGLALLIGALVLAATAYTRAERARMAERTRFDQLRSLANYLVFDLNGQLERTAGNTAARVALAAQAQRYLIALAKSPDASPALRLEAAKGFNRLAQVQGSPVVPNLGLRDQARANLVAADGLLRAIPGNDEPTAIERALNRHHRAMMALHADADQEGAAKLVAEASAALESVPKAQRTTDWLRAHAEALRGQAELLVLSGKFDELQLLAKRMRADTDTWPAPLRTTHDAEFERGYADFLLGQGLNNSGQETRSLPVLRAAEQRFLRLDARSPNNPLVLNALAWTAYEGYGAGSVIDPAESARFLALARRTVDRLVTLEDADQSLKSFAVNIRQAQAEALSKNGQIRDAMALQREVIAGRQAAVTHKRDVRSLSRLGFAHMILAHISVDAADRATACDTYQRSLNAFRDAKALGPLVGQMEDYATKVEARVAECAKGMALGDAH